MRHFVTLIAAAILSSQLAASTLVYFGTFQKRDGQGGEGIYVAEFDESSGSLFD